MARVQRRIGQEVVTLTCEEPHVEQAQWLLEVLEHAGRAGNRLEDGLRIPFGWSTLTLRRRQTGLVVYEPDYDRDPTRELREGACTTLRVTAEMLSTTRRLRVREHFPHHSHRVMVREGWQEAWRVVLVRSVAEEAAESGWLIHPEGQSDGAVSTVRVFELLKLRPGLLSALALPRAGAAVFEDARLVAFHAPA